MAPARSALAALLKCNFVEMLDKLLRPAANSPP
jgi:hypothetical protein